MSPVGRTRHREASDKWQRQDYPGHLFPSPCHRQEGTAGALVTMTTQGLGQGRDGQTRLLYASTREAAVLVNRSLAICTVTGACRLSD